MTTTEPAPPIVDTAWPTERTLLSTPADFSRWAGRATLLSVGVGCLIVMAEIDRVLASIVSTDGDTVTLSALTGPLSLANIGSWAIWAGQAVSAGIFAYAIVDLIFIVAYGSVLWRLARPAALWFWPTTKKEALLQAQQDMSPPTIAVRRWVRWTLRFALLADVIESVLLIAAAAAGPGSSTGLAIGLAIVSLVKWVALALTITLIVGVKVNRRALGVLLRRLASAAKVHRLALVFLLIFAAVALIPSGAIIFDQMPDVQRRWFPMPAAEWGHILWATLGIPLVAVAFWMLGRRRSERAVTVLKDRALPTATPDYRWFIAPPLMVMMAVPVLAVTTTLDPLTRFRCLLIPVAVAVGVAIVVQKRLESFAGNESVTCTYEKWKSESERAARFEAKVIVAALVATALALSAAFALMGPAIALVNMWVVVGIVIAPAVIVSLSLIVRRVWRGLERKRRETLERECAEFVRASGGQGQAARVALAAEDADTLRERERDSVLSAQVWSESEPYPGVPTGFPGTSPGDAQLMPGRGPFLVPPLPADTAEFHPRGILAVRVGDLIAVLVLCLSALGIVRSSVAPVFIAAIVTNDTNAARLLSSATPWLIGGVLGVLALPVAAMAVIYAIDTRLAKRHTQGVVSTGRTLFDPTTATLPSTTAVTVFEVILLVVGVTPIAFAATWPEQFADTLGPIGATVALLGGWSLVLGTAIVALQRRKPLAVFRALGLRSTPVLTIVLIVMLTTATFANTPELHAVRTLTDKQVEAAGVNARAGDEVGATEEWASAAFGRWLARDRSACTGNVRPLLLVVAEGGGARAAYWTANAMAALDDNPCLAGSALVATGISGGSVGLAIDQVDADEWRPVGGSDETSPSVQAVADLTGPNPLARAITGLLVGDLLAGAVGLRFPTQVSDDDAAVVVEWVDRAGHLERGWEAATAVEADGKVRSPLQESMTTGMPASGPLLILNSIDAVSGCRVLVAQNPFGQGLGPIDVLEAGENGSERLTPADCGLSYEPAAGAVTLEQLYPTCTAHLRRSSAAMLSARFPIVTPGGRLPFGACGTDSRPEVQLVDGGYGDPTGLSTMAEIAPAIVSEVAEYNARQTDKTDKFVVPIVVYLRNSMGAGIAESDLNLASELFVPIAGMGARGLQTSEATWLQRLDGVVAEACGGTTVPDSACASETAHLRPTQVVLVAPQTTPAVAPPLGWTLSEMSRSAMDFALKTEAAAITEEGPEACDWARLGDLTAAFTNGTTRVECK